ncbi:HEAT repeat domain-containing protein [Streptomyces sp. CA-288835]|uniref:HEAT repeat domain-containing protein n=1 Tax=Streptomyces sp. CA-288835 TaxID=3240069 RepID=UPI003D94CD4E
MAFWVTAALGASLLLIMVGLLVLLICRVVRNRLDALQASRTEEFRPLVLAAAAGDGDEALKELVSLDRRHWRSVQPSVLFLLSQLQGEGHAALTAVLVRRGIIEEALTDLCRRGRVRRARAAAVLTLAGPTLREDEQVVVRARAALHGLLDDRDPTVRAAAVRALGRFGDATSAALLVAHLRGHRQVASGLIGHALLQIGYPAIECLLEAARGEDVQIRALALELLSLIGDRRSVRHLVNALGDGEGVVRASAAQALGRMGEPVAVDPLMRMLAGDPSPRAASAAAEALGLIGDQRAVGALARAASAPHYRVAHASSQALTRLGPAGSACLRELVADGSAAAAHAREALALLSLRSGGGVV